MGPVGEEGLLVNRCCGCRAAVELEKRRETGLARFISWVRKHHRPRWRMQNSHTKCLNLCLFQSPPVFESSST